MWLQQSNPAGNHQTKHETVNVTKKKKHMINGFIQKRSKLVSC